MLKLNEDSDTQTVESIPNAWQPPSIQSDNGGPSNEQRLIEQQRQFDASLQQAKQAAYQEGMEQAKKALLEQRGTFDALIQCLTQQRDSVSEEAQTHISLLYDCVGLSVNIARKVIQRELSIEPADLVELLKPCLIEHNISEQRLHVHLHLSDLHRLQTHPLWGELNTDCQFSTHPELSEGGMLIETDKQFIDMSIDHRLQTIVDQLYQNTGIEEGRASDE